MKLQCIALDLDFTTLNSQGQLSPRTHRALSCAIEKGVQIIVASGRALRSLPKEILEFKGIRYAVTSNGAAVYDLRTGVCLKQYKLTEQSVRGILRIAEGLEPTKHRFAYEAFIDGKPYAQADYVADPLRYGTKSVSYVQSTRTPVENFREFILQNAAKLDCMDLVIDDPQLKFSLWKRLEEKLPDVYITSSVGQLLEISYKDCGKHSGVRFVLEQLGLPREALAAFGDGDNDAHMLEYAGIGIAVANASEACKAAADRITRSNDEDGVALEIFRLLAELDKQQAHLSKYGR